MNKEEALEFALKKKKINEGLKDILSLDVFVLTGSYFFDCQTKESDFDFFINVNNLPRELISLLRRPYGFYDCAYARYTKNSDVLTVLASELYPVHIQCIADYAYFAKVKANDFLHYQMKYLLNGITSKRTRRDIYMRATNNLIWSLLVTNVLNM